MAIASDVYFSNAVQGIPQVGGPVDIFAKHATPQHVIGTRIQRQDGNEYVYSHFGADTNRGILVASDASESSVVDTDNAVIAPASAQTTSDGTIGSKFIELTLASVTAAQFAGGYFITTDDTGEGYTYRIKGNTATGNPTTGNIRVELYDPLQVALDATTDLAIQGSLYANLEAGTAATDVAVSGVTVSTMDVSVAAYGWVQTKGIVGILQDGVVVIGDVVTLSDGVAGAVQSKDAQTEPQVGHCVIAGDDTGHGVFNIAIL